MKLPEGVAHYVVGSAYLVVHLFTHERRARSVLPEFGTEFGTELGAG